MNLISKRTRRIIRESFQTFIIALFALVFAILLTFVEDFAIQTKRPQWLIIGIEVFSVILFIGDILVITNVVARIVFRAFRDFLDEIRRS
jgi:lipopolysaccharide export LptBFGC system permease protein LptF